MEESLKEEKELFLFSPQVIKLLKEMVELNQKEMLPFLLHNNSSFSLVLTLSFPFSQTITNTNKSVMVMMMGFLQEAIPSSFFPFFYKILSLLWNLVLFSPFEDLRIASIHTLAVVIVKWFVFNLFSFKSFHLPN